MAETPSTSATLRIESFPDRLVVTLDRPDVRVIILRAGDFFGGVRGSWFDLVITKELERGRITYPGPLDVVHA